MVLLNLLMHLRCIRIMLLQIMEQEKFKMISQGFKRDPGWLRANVSLEVMNLISQKKKGKKIEKY